ncbi:MAG: hypothetical protein KJ749_09630, partial [Planctomycetes bacterium]|nr:hypothetical protein [Planctomycetota bacterium]
GMGGGGPVRVTPFTVDELALGSARQSDIRALFAAGSAGSEYRMGFRIGGVVSHAFFRGYALTFDFERMQLLLMPEK